MKDRILREVATSLAGHGVWWLGGTEKPRFLSAWQLAAPLALETLNSEGYGSPGAAEPAVACLVRGAGKIFR